MRARWGRIALGFVAVLAACLALLSFALMGWPPGLARPLVRMALEVALEAPVELRAVEGNLLGRFQLEGLRVGTSETPLRIEVLELESDARTLLDRHLSLTRVVVTGLDASVVVEPGAVWVEGLEALTDAPDRAESEDATSWSISLANLAVRASHLRVRGSEGWEVLAQIDAEVSGLDWPPPLEAGGWPEQATLRARIESAAAVGHSLRDAGLDLTLRGPQIEIELRDLSLGMARLEGQMVAQLKGRLDAPELETLRTDLTASDLDLAPLLGDPQLASQLNGRVAASLDATGWQGRLALEPSTFAGWPIESGEAVGRVSRDGSRVEIDEAQVRAAGIRASGAGTLDDGMLEPLEIADLEIEIDALPSAWRPEGVTRGRVRAHGRVSGPLTDPSGNVSLDASGLALELAGEALRADAQVTMELLGGERYRIDELRVETFDRLAGIIEAEAPVELRCTGCITDVGSPAVELVRAVLRVFDGSLRVAGRIDAERLSELLIEATGLDVAAAARALSPDASEHPAGHLQASLRLDGPFDALRVDGSVDWLEPSLATLGVEADELELRLESSASPASQSLSATLRRNASDVLVVQASVPTHELLLDPDALIHYPGLRASAVAQDVDVEWLASLLRDDWRTLRGRLDAHLEIEGPLAAPALRGGMQIASPRRGELRADRIALDFGSPGPDEPLRVEASLDGDGRRMLGAVATLGNRTHLASPAELLHDPNARATITAEDLDLAWLGSMAGATSLELAGRANGPIELRGGVAEPVINGDLLLSDVTFEGPPLPRAVGPISGRVRFDGKRASLGPIEFEGGKGRATLTGEIATIEPYEVGARLQLEGFELHQPGVLVGEVDGHLELAGRLDALRSRGKLSLSDATIDMPDPRDPIVTEIRVLGLADANAPASIFESTNERDPLDRMSGEVEFELGDDVWLRASGANLRLVGTLKVRKQVGDPPGLFGSVVVEEGTFDFNGRMLKISDGSAHFVGEPDPDPQIDVTALHQVRDVVITVRIFGRASDLRVELESEPPMSEQDMLSYLYFNRPIGDLDEEEQASVGMAASVMAAGALLGPMGTELGEMVGLSRVGVTVEDDQPAIELERQIGSRIRALYSRSFGEAGGDKIVIEYRLFKRLFLSGEAETSGESGFDLIWSHDY